MWPGSKQTRRVVPVAFFAGLYLVATALAIARGIPISAELFFVIFGLVVGGAPFAMFAFAAEDARTLPWVVLLAAMLTLTFSYTFVGPLAVIWAWPLQLLIAALAASPFLQFAARPSRRSQCPPGVRTMSTP